MPPLEYFIQNLPGQYRDIRTTIILNFNPVTNNNQGIFSEHIENDIPITGIYILSDQNGLIFINLNHQADLMIENLESSGNNIYSFTLKDPFANRLVWDLVKTN